MNTTFSIPTNPSFEVIIMVNIKGTSYAIGKVIYNYLTFDEIKNHILLETGSTHPSADFVELLKKHFANYKYITEDDCKNARVDFVFTDGIPTITLN